MKARSIIEAETPKRALALASQLLPRGWDKSNKTYTGYWGISYVDYRGGRRGARIWSDIVPDEPASSYIHVVIEAEPWPSRGMYRRCLNSEVRNYMARISQAIEQIKANPTSLNKTENILRIACYLDPKPLPNMD